MLLRALHVGRSPITRRITPSRFRCPASNPHYPRLYATKSEADIKIEEIQEQYIIAKDEFEIAVEETEKKTIYANEDRQTARDELARLKDLYTAAVEKSEASVASEIKGRVGPRIRELENAVEELNKADLED